MHKGAFQCVQSSALMWCKLSWTESMIPEKSDMLCTVSSPYTAESLALKYQH